MVLETLEFKKNVAYGAAVQAAILSKGFQNVPNLVLRDVTPLSLGTLPYLSRRQKYFTRDNSCKVSIKVYEGERARDTDNNLLGFFTLSCPPGTPRGQPLEVCFAIDENGILTVSAKEISSGNMNEITITNDKERLSAFEIRKMIEEAERYHVEDQKFLRKARVLSELDLCVYKMKNAKMKNDVNLKLSPQESEKINNAITVATDLLDKNNQQKEVDVLEVHLKELESMLQRLISMTE
ncbi:heat shock cognate 70 kDa protein-like [Trifolium pratense]|uniref:heat shock cognate 70 kDa protein-like n=1 Tax=Trifolium pratense TaxID=57577 RepID=UPI001E696D5F|nr:heat shock cognate 70 kDa protein-like [Trifolium pratense]